MYNYLPKLLLVLALIVVQHNGYAQTTKDEGGRAYRNKQPRHRMSFKDGLRLTAERLEIAADLGIGAFLSKDNIDSGRIDPEQTKCLPIPFGSLRVFYNLNAFQLGLGYETGSLAIETMLPVTDGQTGAVSERKGRLYLASPFHAVSAYAGIREEIKKGYLYGGILGGYMAGRTYSTISNDYQPGREAVAGGFFGLTVGYAYFFRHVGVHLEYGFRVLPLNNDRKITFMPFTIGIRYRNYPHFYNHGWRSKYKRPPAYETPVML